MARVEVVIPSYGMTDDPSYVVNWFVDAGERVSADAPLLLLETAKAETEIVAPTSGVVGELLVPAETTVAPGTVVTWIESDG